MQPWLCLLFCHSLYPINSHSSLALQHSTSPETHATCSNCWKSSLISSCFMLVVFFIHPLVFSPGPWVQLPIPSQSWSAYRGLAGLSWLPILRPWLGLCQPLVLQVLLCKNNLNAIEVFMCFSILLSIFLQRYAKHSKQIELAENIFCLRLWLS